MTTMTRELMSNAFDEAVGEVIIGSLGENPLLWTTLFSMRPMSGSQITVASWGDLGPYQLKAESADLVEDKLVQVAKATYVALTYGKILRCTDELIEDQSWIGLQDFGQALGDMGMRQYERLAAQLFNNLTATTYYKDEMGEAIAASTHTDQDSNTLTNYDNSHALALTFDNALTIRAAGKRIPAYSTDELADVDYTELIYPPELDGAAFALTNSALQPGSQNNDANPFSRGFTGYSWSRLTDTNAWGMMDPRLRKRDLRCYMRMPLEIIYDAVWSQRERKIGAYLRFVMACRNGRFVAWSNPS